MASQHSIDHTRWEEDEEEEEKGWSSSWSWSDLPEDILRPAVQQLYITDRIAVRAVCKNWRASAPCFDKLPLLLNYRVLKDRIQCSVLDLLHHQPHHKHHLPAIFREKQKERTTPPGRIMLSAAKACGSSRGWVLFDQVTTVKEADDRLHYVHECYIYNPHTEALQSLPILELQPQRLLEYSRHDVTFFSSSSHNHFTVVVLTACDNARYFLISTYTLGDESWNTRKFYRPGVRGRSRFDRVRERSRFGQTIRSPNVTYMDGCLYYYNYSWGDLWSFRIATGKWTQHSGEQAQVLIPMSGHLPLPHFIGYGGHLHLVYMIRSWTEADPWWASGKVKVECHIFRYDWGDGDWKRMESLEGAALFLGDDSLNSFGISTESEETKMAANRVYYMNHNLSVTNRVYSMNPNLSATVNYKPNFLVYGSTSLPAEYDSSCHPPHFSEDRGTLWMWMHDMKSR